MSIATLLAFLFLILSLVSVWIKRTPLLWGLLLALSMLFGWMGGNVDLLGISLIAGLTLLWFLYRWKPYFVLFIILIAAGFIFSMKILPGFTPYRFTSRFAIGLEGPITGLLPLALIVPLARTKTDWLKALLGLIYGCVGIAILALVAVKVGVVHWQWKLPPLAYERFIVNFFLTCIAEEAFFRGFIQNRLCGYFQKASFSKGYALLITSTLFTVKHLIWSPDIATLGFVFLASLLYGGVYLMSKRIESAIVTHFLLNFIHMTFFSYHAL